MSYIVGIDEAGRGPLAGPLVVGGIWFHDTEALALCDGAKDSKQLSEKRRNEIAACLRHVQKSGRIRCCLARIQPAEIDASGISKAAKRAVQRVVSRLVSDPEHTDILLDGGLSAPASFRQQKTIVGGDRSEPAIALASIWAKVARDAEMARLARTYPDYGLERHKGYGTKAHYTAIRQNGPCGAHRQSFLRG